MGPDEVNEAGGLNMGTVLELRGSLAGEKRLTRRYKGRGASPQPLAFFVAASLCRDL
jgi:hypothetical protein